MAYKSKLFSYLHRYIWIYIYIYIYRERERERERETRSVMVFTAGNGQNDPSSNPEQSCISQSAAKRMNPTILSPAIDKYLGRLGSLTLVWQLAKKTLTLYYILLLYWVYKGQKQKNGIIFKTFFFSLIIPVFEKHEIKSIIQTLFLHPNSAQYKWARKETTKNLWFFLYSHNTNM